MSAALAFQVPTLGSGAVWLTLAQIVKQTRHTSTWFYQIMRKARAAGHCEIKREVRIGRNGKTVYEWDFYHLPAAIRAKLAPPETRLAIMPARPLAMAPLFTEPTTPEPLRISLGPEAEKQANERLELIRPLIEFAADRAKYAALRLGDGRKVTTANLLADYIAETRTYQGKSLSVRTLRRWMKMYRAGGLTQLARKPREDQGLSRFFTRYPAAADLVAAEYLKPCATAKRAHDALVRDREMLRIPLSELPSYGTVNRYLETLPEPAKILAREGLRRYNETCAPHLARGYTDIPANGIWVADHQIHDCYVRNDCFPSMPQDARLRLRLTCIMDMRSRKIVGFCWAVEGDSRGILTALRRAVERFGPPELFYCDNGVDFKKVAKGAQRMRPAEADIRMAAEQVANAGALAQLGVKVQFCLPYHAQSKPVERLFRFVHGRLDGIMHTYLTGNSYNRPDAATLAETHHRQMLKAGRGHESTLMPASFFIKLGETWIEQDYNAQHQHRGKGMNGRTPNAVFDEGYPVAKRRRADASVLALMLYERRTVKVSRTAVTIDKKRWMPVQSSPESWAALSEYNTRSITVAFDPLDQTRAVALNAKGQAMAELQPEELAAHPLAPHAPDSDQTQKQVAGMSQMRGRLLKANVIAVATMHQGVAMAGHKSALEHLAGRVANAGAQAGVPVDHLVSQKAIRRATRPSDTSHAPKSSFDIAADLMKELA